MLSTASEWSVNVGYPGYANPAVAEVVTRSLVPQMFAAVARGQATAKEAVVRAREQIDTVFGRWRSRGLI